MHTDHETHRDEFAPPTNLRTSTYASCEELYAEAAGDAEAFWARQARELLTWSSPFSNVLDWDPPNARWFADGQLNASVNCLDRHVAAGLGDRVAYHWEGEPGDTRTITYRDLLADVERFANVLRGLGLASGDRAAIYMPMIPELPTAMLACARIGVAHSVIFGGFSPDAIADRCDDAEAKIIITADAGYRRGEPSPLKPNVDAALDLASGTVEHVVVVDRCGTAIDMADGRDLWWHELIADADPHCEPAIVDAEHLLFLLYTSGTTAKPKGIMHSTGGYLTQVAFTHRAVFDLDSPNDVYWCAADIGWITGHSYIVYGPLVNAATSVMYEGTPDTPRQADRTGTRVGWNKDRWWRIVANYGVTQLYTAPTAIRTFMRWGEDWPKRHDLSSLRILGSVGEPINPEAWLWYHRYIGSERCAIVDTWWQTETGAHMITPLPARTTTKPGSASHAVPGVTCAVVDEQGEPIDVGTGYLVINQPWPSMLRGIWGDSDRYAATYWSTYEGRYFAGDGARIDQDGHVWILGRVDDVMNVSGHRISTSEVESALVDHAAVAEAAVIATADDLTGQAIVAYVVLRSQEPHADDLDDEIRSHVATKLGPTCRPKIVLIVPDLPKTRSGKIMRRLLRDLAEGREIGDTTTLADPGVVETINGRVQPDPQVRGTVGP